MTDLGIRHDEELVKSGDRPTLSFQEPRLPIGGGLIVHRILMDSPPVMDASREFSGDCALPFCDAIQDPRLSRYAWRIASSETRYCLPQNLE